MLCSLTRRLGNLDAAMQVRTAEAIKWHQLRTSVDIYLVNLQQLVFFSYLGSCAGAERAAAYVTPSPNLSRGGALPCSSE